MRALAGVLVALLLGLGLQGCATDPSPVSEHVAQPVALDRPVERVEPDVLPGMVISRIPHESRDASVRPGRRLHVDGEVLPILTAPVVDGAAQLPGGLDEAGWLATTRRPGADAGTTTLAVHSSRNGDAPLQGLHGLDHGSTVTVEWAGERHRYRVQRRIEDVDPLQLPQGLVAQVGPHRIALVTCGDFDWATETWQTRTIVWLMPV